MGRLAAVILGGVVTVAVSGCGAPSVPVHSAAAVPATPGPHSPAATASATPVPRLPDLVVATATHGNGTTVILLRSSGDVVAQATSSRTEQWTFSAGPGGAYWVDAGHLHRLDAQGHVSDLGAVAAGQSGRVAVSPDGSTWVYATQAFDPDGSITNRLWRGSAGAAPTMIAERVSDPQHPGADAPARWVYSVRRWTNAGVLVVREPAGGCGCIPFDMETVSAHAFLVDPQTGLSTPVGTDATCPVSGTPAPDGTVACFRVEQDSIAADELRVVHGAAVVQSYPLSGSNVGGDATFDAAHATLAYATVGATKDCGQWMPQSTLRVLDVAGGEAHVVGPAGLQPSAWLSDGRILATYSRVVAGGTPDISVVAVDVHSGAITTLFNDPTSRVIGLAA